ncbi:MAG: TetR/AcrR family transcriptional regulator, partial [Dongiaceae bacterium]
MTLDTPSRSRKTAGAPSRSNDPEGTRLNIIEVATKEFAEYGLSGARIDEIAAKTKSSKRMIYYYFGDKEGLYLKVLEEAYSRVRAEESKLDLDDLAPLDALRRLVEFTFDHHNANQDFIRLVMIENIHHGEYLQRSSVIQELNIAAIDVLERL